MKTYDDSNNDDRFPTAIEYDCRVEAIGSYFSASARKVLVPRKQGMLFELQCFMLEAYETQVIDRRLLSDAYNHMGNALLRIQAESISRHHAMVRVIECIEFALDNPDLVPEEMLKGAVQEGKRNLAAGK